jgi:hypothetical protein
LEEVSKSKWIFSGFEGMLPNLLPNLGRLSSISSCEASPV